MNEPQPNVFPNYIITSEQMRLVGAALALAWQIEKCEDEIPSAIIAGAKYVTEKDTELLGACKRDINPAAHKALE